MNVGAVGPAGQPSAAFKEYDAVLKQRLDAKPPENPNVKAYTGEKAGTGERIGRAFLALGKLVISVVATAATVVLGLAAVITYPTVVGYIVFGALAAIPGWVADTAFKSMVNDLTIVATGHTLKDVNPDSYFLKGFREKKVDD